MTVQTAGWVPSAETFPARLALVRQRMGWNVKEAALACGLGVSTWRGWEIDGSRPQNYVEVCRSIASATGCNYRWLMDGDDDGPRGGEQLPHLDSNQEHSGLRSRRLSMHRAILPLDDASPVAA